MGKVRDFLRGVGILSSAGITVSNAGTRLLDLRNDLNSIGRNGTGKPVAEERMGYARQAPPKGTARSRAQKRTANRQAPSRRTTAKGGPATASVKGKSASPAKRASPALSAAQLEHKREYNRERMRRIRAKETK